jgi:hypothetical protein
MVRTYIFPRLSRNSHAVPALNWTSSSTACHYTMATADEIKEAPSPYADDPHTDTQQAEVEDKFEVFKRGDGQVDFRTVSWIRASVIFLKSQCPQRVTSSSY